MTRARRDPAAWGVMERWTDAKGMPRRLAPATVEALLDALGADAERPADDGPVLVRPGERRPLDGPVEVVLEDGTRLGAGRHLGPDLPLGYHRIEPVAGGASRTLIVAPPRCHLDAGLRDFGLAVQLYALRSRRSWGIGDLADLRDLGRWAASLGAGFVLLNPLHAPVPAIPQQPSPYSPSSRRFRTPLALRIEEVAGADRLGSDLGRLGRAGRRLNRDRQIDRDAVWRLKLEALERIWAVSRPSCDPRFSAFRAEQGEALQRFALHSALVEDQGRSWRGWPASLRHGDPTATRAAAERLRERVELYAFAQWQLDLQLGAAARPLRLMQDLAVGVDPEGADAWIDQGVLAAGVHVGAPPDEFNARGQDWGLPPYDPWRLRAAAHGPLAETLRACMRHGAALRVDHVMGFFRLWWVPPDRGPAEGGYVRYPAEEMLAVLALESTRAAAHVVGEDLGTVEPGIRRALAAHDVLSYRVLWFEDVEPAGYPEASMAALTTHDLPTVAGLWSGADLAAQRRLGMLPDPAAEERVRRRVLAIPGVKPGSRPATVVRALHAALAAAPARLVAGTLDDLLVAAERPNMPGTVDEWPNWRIPLPATLERVITDPGVRRRAEALRPPPHRPRRPDRGGRAARQFDARAPGWRGSAARSGAATPPAPRLAGPPALDEEQRMSDGAPLGFRTAGSLLEAMRGGELSPVEVVDAVLAHIEAAQPHYNAFTVVLAERARAQARESERRIVAGEARALEGLPLPVKDNVLLEGVPMSDGSRVSPTFDAPFDTELVARLRRAGAVFVGKTNLPEFGTISTTENLRFGPTRNPWDLGRTAGGSSGGSAAAVAAGIVPAAHGNDGGGSLRIPAACCGIFSLKPTRGRVPRGPLPGNDPGLLTVDGFLSRGVADNALLLDACAGYALGDPLTAIPQERPFAAEVGAAPGRLRIGFTATPPLDVPVDPAHVAAVESAARLCEALGHDVEPFTPSWLSDSLLEDFLILWAGLIGAQLDFYASLGGDASLAEPHNRALREQARGVDAARFALAAAQLQMSARQGLASFEAHDVVLTPTLAMPPVPLGWHFEGADTDPMAVLVNATRFTPFTAVANVSGQPVAALPLDWSGGLCAGVSAFGRPHQEATLLRLSAQLEAARPWAQRRPPQPEG